MNKDEKDWNEDDIFLVEIAEDVKDEIEDVFDDLDWVE